MKRIIERQNHLSAKCREPCYMLKKLIIGFDLIMLTGLIAYGLLVVLMWFI